MNIARIRDDLRTTWQVIRELREAINRPAGQPPPLGPALQNAPVEMPTPWAGRGRVVACRYIFGQLLFFSVSFFIALLPANRIPRTPEEFERKIAYLSEHPERYDIVFIGSSRIKLGMPVKQFDAELALRNIDLGPSFNLGALESAMHQNFYIIRQLLDAGVRPRYLVVEAAGFTSKLRNSRMKRFEVWHDAQETVRVLTTTLQEKEVPAFYGNRIERAWMHLLYFLRRNFPIGRVNEFAKREDLEPAATASFESSGGYQPLDKDHATDPEARGYFENPDQWNRRIAALKDAYDGNYPEPLNLAAFGDLIEYVKARGVQLVFVGTPHSTVEWMEPLLWMEQAGWVASQPTPEGLPLFLNFNLPSLPYVTNLDLRYDEDHINNAGAQLWAKDFARVFAEAAGP